jgi:hypothetical protein
MVACGELELAEYLLGETEVSSIAGEILPVDVVG